MDWNFAAEQLFAACLGSAPGVGVFLSALVNIFWPSSGDVWDQIKQQVEELIDQRLSQEVYQQVHEDLQGLNNDYSDYLQAVAANNPANISDNWTSVKQNCDAAVPHFQDPGNEVLLLPLYAGFASLYLALLRDGVMFGANWGWNDVQLSQALSDLQSSISKFQSYAMTTYNQGLSNVTNTVQINLHLVEPFRTVNRYERQMALTVLDFVDMWTYMDPSKYPPPVSFYLDREIYSDPNGTADDSGLIVPREAPSKPITTITVWGADRINGVEVQYPPGGGPLGVTTTGRMGAQTGGSNQPPGGGVIDASSNPVVEAVAYSGNIVDGLQFVHSDGTWTQKLGHGDGGGEYFNYSYPGEILSSIWINGVSNFYQCADVVIFGFKYDQTSGISEETLKTVYVSSPKEMSVDALANWAGMDANSTVSLQERASTGGWDRERQNYISHLKAPRH